MSEEREAPKGQVTCAHYISPATLEGSPHKTFTQSQSNYLFTMLIHFMFLMFVYLLLGEREGEG